MPGIDHALWIGDTDQITDEVEEFLTGSRADVEPDRVLATVMFTDIVDLTKRASELGDRRWQGVLEQHDEIIRRELEKFRGRAVKTLGDGVLATFDGPARAVRCATSVIDAVRSLDLRVRSGIHTGEIELKGDDIAGLPFTSRTGGGSGSSRAGSCVEHRTRSRGRLEPALRRSGRSCLERNT